MDRKSKNTKIQDRNMEWNLEEYKLLRGEIISDIRDRTLLLIYMTTMTIALIGYSYVGKAPELLLFIPTVNFPCLLLWVQKRIAALKISQYIGMYIEDKAEGPHWESTSQMFREKRGFPSLYSSFGIAFFFLLIGLFCSIYYIMIINYSIFAVVVTFYNFFLALIIVNGLWNGQRIVNRAFKYISPNLQKNNVKTKDFGHPFVSGVYTNKSQKKVTSHDRNHRRNIFS